MIDLLLFICGFLFYQVNDFFMPAPSSIMVKDEILTDSLSPPQKFSLNALRRGKGEPPQ